ncbi:Protein kinase domain-containing protein [Mucilaginibacter mallensis]|uniref:Protein kinase domain-containing protein n=1 Tax=Mucilaginibacter mallensis TaxID=652787 RepID=A0A1H2CDR0_MUCMA|nr:Protein kinase domain-containing protein [Mucilaginibacter mallensis]
MDAASKEISGTIYNSNPGGALVINPPVDYGSILTQASLSFYNKHPYLHVGDIIPLHGWVLYISVIRQEMVQLLNILLPFLIDSDFTFTIPENSDVHSMILDGAYGVGEIGKVIAIYPDNDIETQKTADLIIELAKPFSGPTIPSAYHLKGCVYTENLKPSNNLNDWPYPGIPKPTRQKERKKIKNYLIINQLKGDAKGNVYKCLNLKNWLKIHWCVIKQGRFNHCADDFGRTIKDRLEWQYELLIDLNASIPLPKPIDYFEDGGDSYLVMEYIRGHSLFEKIMALHQGIIWFAIPAETKRQLVKYILEIINIIDLFDYNGIIHRDINPGNFLIREDESVVAIDIELAFDACGNVPPFTYGTPGYISPQQQQLQAPDIADDIFGLGSLILKVMTGISPGKFSINDQLFQNIKFFMDNNAVAAMTALCMSGDSSLRPGLKSIRHTMDVYDAVLLTENLKTNFSAPKPKISKIEDVIQKGINAFASNVLQNNSGYWVSKAIPEENGIANEFKSYLANPGFANGVAGVLYVLSLAEQLNFNTVDLYENILLNYELLLKTEQPYCSISSGLFRGKTGFSIAINELIIGGLIENTVYNHNLVFQNISEPLSGNNVASGISGQGLAFLHCSNNRQLPVFYDELSLLVARLIKEQNKDGSWLVKKDETQAKGIKLYGFSYGIAGITYFLIEYYTKYEDQKVKDVIVKALDFLLKGRKVNNGELSWPISAVNENFDPWFEYGFSGIALTFIKAYQILGDSKYRKAAETALNCHPKYISSNFLTVANGLAGLGEVYLEAFKVFNDCEWFERAGHIVNVLLHTYREAPNSRIYWLEGNDSLSAADLMSGNIGIIHFLLHYLRPDKIKFLFNID